jgi:two-component system, LytTR family, sensor histidine kinase AlgZ
MDNHAQPEPFLPDLCAGRAVVSMLVISEIVAIVLALAQAERIADLPTQFLPLALFLPWIGLASAAVLCGLRHSPLRSNTPRLVGAAFVALLLTHALISQGAWNLMAWLDLGDPLITDSEMTFLIRNLGLSLIVSTLVLAYFYLLHQWQRTVQLQARSREAALRARIRPHFLFNALNTAAALIRSQPDTAELVVEDLSELFRASLSTRDRVSFGEELAFARLYQRLEQTRLGDRLTVEWRVDALPEDLMVPALLLQPLLENAVGHGIESLPGGGSVVIEGALTEGVVHLSVSNPVPDQPTAAGHSMALENIRERLELVYGDEAALGVESSETWFKVSLLFPEVHI